MPEVPEALAAYDLAWRTSSIEARNAICQQLADDYVLAHPELRDLYGSLTLPELVEQVSFARAAGDEARRIELDIWIMREFEFQKISGAIAVGGAVRHEITPINPEGDRRSIGVPS